jgi:hypothetical protein
MLLKLLAPLSLICLVGLAGSRAVAQAPGAPAEKTAEEKEAARAELRKKSFDLLDVVVGDARALRVPENRVRILAGAADLLWPHDEKRARALFREAVAHVNEAAQRARSGDAERRQRIYWSVMALREETLRTAARRDPQLALELLHATRQPPLPVAPANADSAPDAELRLENQLALQVAAADPKRAQKMAEESLARGLSFEVADLAGRLHELDAEAGRGFAAEVVRKIRAESLTRGRLAAFIAARLLEMTRAGNSSFVMLAGAGEGRAAHLTKPLKLDAQVERDLLDLLVTSALKGGESEYFEALLEPRLAEIEKHWPERAAALRRRIEGRRGLEDAGARAWRQYAPLWSQESPEPLLEAAAKAPPQVREGLYTGAAWKAAEAGDHERARRILEEHLRDSPNRAKLLEHLDHLTLAYNLRRNKLEEAHRLMGGLRPKERRAAALAQLATLAAAAGDKKLARELLEEARPLAGPRPRNVEQLNAHLQLARGYALVEPARSFEIVEAVVDRANEMIAAADILDGFLGGPEIFRSDELVMHAGLASLEGIFNQYGKELAELARTDFERAASAAARFQRLEVRTMARLLIAQGLLSDRKPTGPSPEDLMRDATQ